MARKGEVRSSIDEDHPCLPHMKYSDRQHGVATEVLTLNTDISSSVCFAR